MTALATTTKIGEAAVLLNTQIRDYLRFRHRPRRTSDPGASERRRTSIFHANQSTTNIHTHKRWPHTTDWPAARVSLAK